MNISRRKKIVFIGTPSVASIFLHELCKNGFKPDFVITQPDKPFGRDKKILPPPVKIAAFEHNIQVFQPFDSRDLSKVIKEIKPDIGIIVAYGKLLSKDSLEYCSTGFFNIHFSFLPSYRGADPVRWVIINKEIETGVSIFKVEEKLDSGEILVQEKILIDKDETSITLLNKLVDKAKKMIINVMPSIISGNFTLFPQKGVPTYAPKLYLKDTYINFYDSVENVYARIRAFSYDPYSRFVFLHDGKEYHIQIISAQLTNIDDSKFSCGRISGFEKNKGIFVKCLNGSIFLKTIKPQGKKEMNAYDFFINGIRLKIGDFVYERK
ncbi:MAG: methionyl-tRNA formyltransferase [Elusimicrobiota bacterium]